MVKFDSQGSIAWQVPLTRNPAQGVAGCPFALTPAQDIWVFSLLTSNTDGEVGQRVAKLSRNGDLLASRFLKDELSFFLFGAAAGSNGAVGTGYTTATGKVTPYFRKLSDAGDLEWATTLSDVEGSVRSAAIDADGTVYGAVTQTSAPVGTNGVLVRLAANGQVLWRRPFDRGRDSWDSYDALALVSDGVLVAGHFGGSIYDPRIGPAIVRKFAKSGELVWEYEFGDRFEVNIPSQLVSGANGDAYIASWLGDESQLHIINREGEGVWIRRGVPVPGQPLRVTGLTLDSSGNLLLLASATRGGRHARMWTFFQ